MRIVSRERWGARGGRGDPTTYSAATVTFIHHSAFAGAAIDSYAEQAAAMRQVERQHLGQGWDGIGYTHVVFQPYSRRRWHRARVFEGRGLGHIPAAQSGHNRGNVAICVVGNFEHEPVRRGTVRKLVSLVKRMPGHTLKGHRDVNPTACPGDRLYAKLPEIRKRTGKTGDRP